MLFPGLPVLLAAALLLVLAACPSSTLADDTGTNFFLKASKSVPRIGRRSEYDIYLKTPKNVPRIGRRREMSPLVSNKALCKDGSRAVWVFSACWLVLGLGGCHSCVKGGGCWAPRGEVAERDIMDCDLKSDPKIPEQKRRKKERNKKLSKGVVGG